MMKLIKSFGYAFKGIFIAAREEQNMRIHILAIALVTFIGIYLGLTAIEWSIIALTIGMVISLEMVNSAIEAIVDHLSPEYHKEAGKVKDLAAGAVLIAAIVATVIAVYIFGNKVFNLIF